MQCDLTCIAIRKNILERLNIKTKMSNYWNRHTDLKEFLRENLLLIIFIVLLIAIGNNLRNNYVKILEDKELNQNKDEKTDN